MRYRASSPILEGLNDVKIAFAVRVLIIYLFALAAQQAPAQTLGNLTGEVVGGALVDSRWSVELRNLTESAFGSPDRAYLTSDGRFQIGGVKFGSYEVTLLDPEQRASKREIVFVNGGHSANQVRIRLDEGRSAPRPAGVISLGRLAHKVPKPAAKEFKQARRDRERNRLPQAETHYLNALELDPQFLEAANDLGALYYRLGRYAEAHRVFEEAQAIDADSPVVLSNLAASLLALRRPLDAEPLAARALKLDPTGVRVRYLYALSKAANKRADAEVRAMLLDVSPSIPQAHLALAQLYTAEGNRPAARAAIQQYLAATKPPPGPARTQAEGWLNSLR